MILLLLLGSIFIKFFAKADNNFFPMVFIHGLLGNPENEYSFTKMDEVYWENVLNAEILGTENYYEAKVSPLGSVHDRACQLYSSLRGLPYVYYGHEYIDNSTGLVTDNFREKRGSTHNKTRPLLKRDELGKFREFPNGMTKTGRLNGEKYAWSKTNKVHLIGHSLGALTIRWLQYLLKIAFFPDLEHDSSNWIASITSITGCLNGATSIYMLGIDQQTGKLDLNHADYLLSIVRLINSARPIFSYLSTHLNMKKTKFFDFMENSLSFSKRIVTGIGENALFALNKAFTFLFSGEEHDKEHAFRRHEKSDRAKVSIPDAPVNEKNKKIKKIKIKPEVKVHDIEEDYTDDYWLEHYRNQLWKRDFDYDMQHLGVSNTDDILTFLQKLIEKGILTSVHNAIYSCTLQSSLYINSIAETLPDSYYFSYAVSSTKSSKVKVKCHRRMFIVEECDDWPLCLNVKTKVVHELEGGEEGCPVAQIPDCFKEIKWRQSNFWDFKFLMQLRSAKIEGCDMKILEEYILSSFFIGQFEFDEKPLPDWKLEEDMLRNDGVISVFSQTYPRVRYPHIGKPNIKPWGEKEAKLFDWKEDVTESGKQYEIGQWNYAIIQENEGYDHTSAHKLTESEFQRKSLKYQNFFKIFKRLRYLKF